MKYAGIAATCVALIVTSVACAAPRSITLKVPGMTCPTCPITVKKALLKDQGVKAVTVHYEKQQLVVVFDDAKITPAAIMKSTAAVGFPSQLAK